MMDDAMRRGSRILLLSVALVLGVALLVGTYLGLRALQEPPLHERFPLIKVGMAESEVRDILGEPDIDHRVIRTGERLLHYNARRMNYVVFITDGRVSRVDRGSS